MKTWIVLLLATGLVLRAEDTPPPAAPAPDDDTALHQGYPAERYQDLWTKSPFAVETPDQAVTDTADYDLKGVAQVDGVTYVSLIDKHTQDHLLVSSDKPLGGLKLNSVEKKPDGTYATLTVNGELLTLKLDTTSEGGGNMAMPENGPGAQAGYQPQVQNIIQMPGSTRTNRPFIRLHRPTILVPPRNGNGYGVPGNNSNPRSPGQPTPPTAVHP